MDMYYPTAAGVIEYIETHQGIRWGDAGPAAGLEGFSHGDAGEGPAVWAEVNGAPKPPRHAITAGYD